MFTTFHSESVNAFFNGYVHPTTKLHDFVIQFNLAVDDCFQPEKQADYESNHKSLQLVYGTPLEKHASKIYTKALFGKFQKQLGKALCLRVEMKSRVEGLVNYEVYKYDAPNSVYNVVVNEIVTKASCSCKKYEYSGVLCSHILRVFDKLDIFEIPGAHIMKRWTKRAKEGEVFDETGRQLKSDYNGDSSIRYQCLYLSINKVAKDVSNDAEIFKLVMSDIEKWQKKLIENKTCVANTENCTSTDATNESIIVEEKTSMNAVVTNDPFPVRTKGTKRNARSLHRTWP